MKYIIVLMVVIGLSSCTQEHDTYDVVIIYTDSSKIEATVSLSSDNQALELGVKAAGASAVSRVFVCKEGEMIFSYNHSN